MTTHSASVGPVYADDPRGPWKVVRYLNGEPVAWFARIPSTTDTHVAAEEWLSWEGFRRVGVWVGRSTIGYTTDLEETS